MNKISNRILAFLLSFTMIFGLIAPLSLATETNSGVVEKSLEDLKEELKEVEGEITEKEKDVKAKEDAVTSLKELEETYREAEKAYNEAAEDQTLKEAFETARKALFDAVKEKTDDEYADTLEEETLKNLYEIKKQELKQTEKKAKEELEDLKARKKELEEGIYATVKVNILNNGSKTGTSADSVAINVTATVNGKNLDANNSIQLEKGTKDVKITFSTLATGYRVLPKYNSVTEKSGKMDSGTYTIDEVKEDTTLEFIIVKTSIQVPGNIKAEHGQTNIYATLPRSAVGMKYVGYLDDKELGTPNKEVLRNGLIIFTSNKTFQLNDKIYYYLIDSNGFYSEKGLITATYKNIFTNIEDVHLGAETIKGALDKGFVEHNDLVFEVYRIVNGKKEAQPIEKFEKSSIVNRPRQTYTIDKDKKTFELNYRFFNFKLGEEYALVAKQGYNSTQKDYEWQSERVFEITDSHAIQNLERIKGTDRYATALEIAKKVYPTTNTVVLASGLSTADALAAGPLANALKAPILLTQANAVTEDVKAYLKSAGVKNVVIVGGEAVVSAELEKSLKETYEVTRYKGADRFETSVKVAEELIDKHNYSKDTVLLANGITQIDALSASRLAQVKKYALVLTPNNQRVTSVSKFFTNRNISKVQVIGGTGAVSTTTTGYYDLTVDERYSGKDRFETALDIAKRGLVGEKIDAAIIANGMTIADALTASSLAYEQNGVIVLVNRDVNVAEDASIKYIKDTNLNNVIIVGGSAAVSENIFDYLNLR